MRSNIDAEIQIQAKTIENHEQALRRHTAQAVDGAEQILSLMAEIGAIKATVAEAAELFQLAVECKDFAEAAEADNAKKAAVARRSQAFAELSVARNRLATAERACTGSRQALAAARKFMDRLRARANDEFVELVRGEGTSGTVRAQAARVESLAQSPFAGMLGLRDALAEQERARGKSRRSA